MRLLLLITLSLLQSPLLALQNQLADHPSPYLAMHGNDPVHWQDWGKEALEQARQEDKLLFVSSGYFSCHWCHVMQQESYRDPAVAKLLNEYFIPVKLDRELHPALDAHLIDFLERTQGQAGWPLNVFLTPEGYPLVGLTYAPRDNFKGVLKQLSRVWSDDKAQTRQLAQRAQLALQLQQVKSRRVDVLSADVLLKSLQEAALEFADLMEGGFGNQSRFPMAPQLLALLEVQARSPDPKLGDFLRLTLDQMANGGLRDHLAGGFFRYTVDPGWQVPHFEKMLYTQALLAQVYLRAAKLFAEPRYEALARETLDFMLTRMRGDAGGFIASLSAVDDKGEEGGVYLWTSQQLVEVLGEQDAVLAQRHWRMLGTPPTEGGYLPVQGEDAAALTGPDGDAKVMTARLETLRQQLLRARDKRGLPADKKYLAGWNGLALAAFAEAALTLDEPRYLDAAGQLRGFLIDGLWRDGVLYRARHNGGALGQAALEDYAYLARGLAAWTMLESGAKDGALLRRVLGQAWQRFHEQVGWQSLADSLLPGMAVEAAQEDGDMPAPSAEVISLSRVLGGELSERAKAAAEAARREAQQQPLWYVGHALLLLEAAQR